MSEVYLTHHGILGQKWGIRRYQKFDGSYTKAGLKRYSERKEEYEAKKAKYKNTKQAYKEGTASRHDLKVAKSNAKMAKNRMNKQYDHLAKDMSADKGKVRYAEGERIRDNNRAAKAMKTVGGLTIVGAAVAYRTGMVDKKVGRALVGVGAAGIVGGTIYKHAKDIPNKQLRDYYSHTSKLR